MLNYLTNYSTNSYFRNCDDKTWLKLEKILKVWDERSIYNKEQIGEFKTAIGERKVSTVPGPKRPSEGVTKSESKKVKTSVPSTVASEVAGSLDLPIPQEGTVINSEILVRALEDMERSASKDSKSRDKIANLPPEVTDPSLLGRLTDKKAGDRLLRQLDEASSLLAKYNEQLSEEMSQRKAIGIMLATFIKNQSDRLMRSEEQLRELKEKVKQVEQVKKQLKSHLSNLPDLRMLPSIALPSAGDLFNAANSARGKPSSIGSSSASPTTSPDTPC